MERNEKIRIVSETLDKLNKMIEKGNVKPIYMVSRDIHAEALERLVSD